MNGLEMKHCPSINIIVGAKNELEMSDGDERRVMICAEHVKRRDRAALFPATG
ncbi:hypothetical protein [Paraburkholderia sediminicola]|uniref:hypothetical protein n=1 Tax=Paraburkholderia sediminicola TaxID=458836 RepID=UPI0038B708B4